MNQNCSVEYTVTDGNGLQSTSTISFTVVPTSLIANPDGPDTVSTGDTQNVDLVANDTNPEGTGGIVVTMVDGQDITAGPITTADGIVATLLADGTVDFNTNGVTPDDYTITYQVTDAEGDVSQSTYDLTVQEAPLVKQTLPSWTGLSGTFTDADGINLTFGSTNNNHVSAGPTVGGDRYILGDGNGIAARNELFLVFDSPVQNFSIVIDDIDGNQFEQESVTVKGTLGGVPVIGSVASGGNGTNDPIISGSPGSNPTATSNNPGNNENPPGPDNIATFVFDDVDQIIVCHEGNYEPTSTVFSLGVGVQLPCWNDPDASSPS